MKEMMTTHMGLLTYSPDLNPIEDAWDIMLGRAIAKVELQPTREKLLTKLQIQWAQTSQQAIIKLHRMRRLREWIAKRGGPLH